ncbi:MAG: hypothetical protein MJ214_04540 [Bacilli bacterium]|nr:hypothetical protein [Bacilli bacterium]
MNKLKNQSTKMWKKPIVFAVCASAMIGTATLVASCNKGEEPVVKNTYTVVLNATKDGQFSNGKDYLIFNNVEEGNTVNSIEGYSLPTYIGELPQYFSFTHWSTSGQTSFDLNTPITSNLFLTANYDLNADYYRDLYTPKTQDEYNKAFYGTMIHPEYSPLDILDKLFEYINKAISDKSITKTKEDIELTYYFALKFRQQYSSYVYRQIIDPTLSDCIIDTLKQIYSLKITGDKKVEGVKRLIDAYIKTMDDNYFLTKSFSDCVKLIAHASNDDECEVYSYLGEAFITSINFIEEPAHYDGQLATLQAVAKNVLKDAKDNESLIHLTNLASGYIASLNKIIYQGTEIEFLNTTYQKEYANYLNPTEITSKKEANIFAALLQSFGYNKFFQHNDLTNIKTAFASILTDYKNIVVEKYHSDAEVLEKISYITIELCKVFKNSECLCSDHNGHPTPILNAPNELLTLNDLYNKIVTICLPKEDNSPSKYLNDYYETLIAIVDSINKLEHRRLQRVNIQNEKEMYAYLPYVKSILDTIVDLDSQFETYSKECVNALNKKMLELSVYHNDIDEEETNTILSDLKTKLDDGRENLSEIVNIYCDFIIGKANLKLATRNTNLGEDDYKYSNWKNTISDIATTISEQKRRTTHHYIETIGKAFTTVYPHVFVFYFETNKCHDGLEEATRSTNFVIDAINACFNDFLSEVTDKYLNLLDLFFGDARMFHPKGKELIYGDSGDCAPNMATLKKLFETSYYTLFKSYFIPRYTPIFDQLATVCINDFRFYLSVPYDNRFDINIDTIFNDTITKMNKIIEESM